MNLGENELGEVGKFANMNLGEPKFGEIEFRRVGFRRVGRHIFITDRDARSVKRLRVILGRC